MANSTPLLRSPNLTPHVVIYDKIMLPHAPHLSPVHANDAPVANLIAFARGGSQNKHVPTPREKTGHTPARKKHGGVMRHALFAKARGAIQELLALELFCIPSLTALLKAAILHRIPPIVTPIGDAPANIKNNGLSSNDDDYIPMPESLLLPLPTQKHKVNNKKSKPKVVLDRSFLCFL
jgi:hypothetical protein